MVKKVRAGISFSEAALAIDDIKSIGAAGMFVASEMTLRNMTTTSFAPELADRQLRETWVEEGSSSIHQRALNKAMSILSSPNLAALDADTDMRVRAEFAGIVAGDSSLPEGWRRLDVGHHRSARERRVNTRRRIAG